MKTAENDFFMENTYNQIFTTLKDILQLFSDYAVETNEDGTISKVHEHVYYRHELEKLQSFIFSNEEVQEYRLNFDRYMKQLEQIEEEAIKEVKNGKIIPAFYLFRMFEMTTFEKFVFYLSFAAASQSQFKRIFTLLSNDYEREFPSVELCAEFYTLDCVERMALCQSFTEHISNFEVIYKYNIFRGNNAQNMLQVPVVISNRIYNFLWDVGSENQLLSQFVTIHLPAREIEPLLVNTEVLDGMKRMSMMDDDKRILFLFGDEGCGRKLLLKHFCKEAKAPLLMADVEKMYQLCQDKSLDDLVSEIVLEAILKGNAFIAFTDVNLDGAMYSFVEKIIWQMDRYSDFFGFTLTSENKKVPKTTFTNYEIVIDELTVKEREVVWKTFLNQDAKSLGMNKKDIELFLNILPTQFVLTPGAIKNSINYVKQQLSFSGMRKISRELMAEACQRQISHQLSLDATKIKTIHAFEDLILPDAQKKMLIDACNRIRYRNKVFSEWGFNQKLAYGKGTSLIFYGPPGTGKTMGAQVLAKELGMELYKVDMAKVLSKYVGESEKKLGEIFEHGKKSQSILFFDEADALFGKRSEVKDSQDKYANASTAFLLQKIEEYEGVIILATNLLQNFDAAFMRRFQFIIEFPFPDEEQRIEIWKNVFPKNLPLEELDYDFLGKQFKLSGSQIKNIALAAAFLVVADDRAVSMKDVFYAMKRENSKVGKNMIATDFGGYYYLMEEGE